MSKEYETQLEELKQRIDVLEYTIDQLLEILSEDDDE